ncbi:MAG: bifunctional histidinol-phosphatase/imidazoleglycerol-phosphate dehydratase HisB [Bdellovibrionales bacterium]|nr:bifunctional histidinol-phosphatase/imidazoleglycerol-phosphate dehydratase HisB [Bdellovibrionales bacterium]
MTSYLFLDRDGTLITEPEDFQIDSIEKFHFVPGVFRALESLKNAGFKFVMISNQDGLGTSTYPREKFDCIQKLLLESLSSQGFHFEKILICPHFEIQKCDCRKPKTTLVREYLASNEMDRSRSFVIGDRPSDMELAENMGLQGRLLSKDNTWDDIVTSLLYNSRQAFVNRNTKETQVQVEVSLDHITGTQIQTGLGFFDHMLEQLSLHGGFSLKINAKGDLHIDDHHLIEDVGLALGMALKQALGNKKGIGRYGFYLPMDEATSQVTLDISGRPFFQFQAEFPAEKVGGLSTEMIPHFFQSLCQSLGMSLHISTFGENTHHMVEATFKSVGRSLRSALKKEGDALPSTKGSL